MGTLYSLVFGPTLYRELGQPERIINIPETLGNTSMSLAKGVFYFTTSLAFGPVLLTYMYSRGMLNTGTVLFIMKYATVLTILAFGGRCIGRAMDPSYRSFLGVWSKASQSGRKEDNEELRKYDFELTGVNADFVALPNPNLWYHQAPLSDAGPITRTLSWYAIHAFGRQMLYPGSMALLNWILGTNLQNARTLMITAKGGKRAWIRSAEGDLIDTMFIRGPNEAVAERRQTLVISCEGNAGFYEIGVAMTPAQLGYSVLGWNHPGFGESSGLPFPTNTLAAADAVMQYALTVLGFREDQIVIFGWSIGGYPASWLGANYPNVKGLVLDATFDDVLPLAESRMPKFLSGVVQYAIRQNFNLEIHRLVAHYSGPLRLIRRLQEEILTIDDGSGDEHMKRASNRANYLLKEILRSRHPEVVKGLEPQVDRWLAMTHQERAMSSAGSLETDSGRRVAKLFEACEHYLVDFDATHVAPLDPGYFNLPQHCRVV